MPSMHLNVLKLGTTTSSVLIEKSVHVRLVKKKKKKNRLKEEEMRDRKTSEDDKLRDKEDSS